MYYEANVLKKIVIIVIKTKDDEHGLNKTLN